MSLAADVDGPFEPHHRKDRVGTEPLRPSSGRPGTPKTGPMPDDPVPETYDAQVLRVTEQLLGRNGLGLGDVDHWAHIPVARASSRPSPAGSG